MEAEVNLDVEGLRAGCRARWTRAARLGGLQVGLEVVRIYDHNLNSQTRLDF